MGGRRRPRFSDQPSWRQGLLVFAVIGELGEAGGSDYIVRLPQGRLVPALAGVVAAAAVVGVVVGLSKPSRARLLWPVAFAAAAGGWGAFVLRVVSAASDGANIGGGILMLVGPVVFIALVGVAIATTGRAA